MSTPEPEVKRWTAKRKTQVVLDILKGKTPVAEVARRYDLKPGEIKGWVWKMVYEPVPETFMNNMKRNSRKPMQP